MAKQNKAIENVGDFTHLDKSSDFAKWGAAMDYLSAYPKVKTRRKASFKMLEISKAKNVLDVGCGLGDTTRMMSALLPDKGKIIGLDFSEKMLSIARVRSKSKKEIYVFGNVEKLNYPNNSFDRVYVERVLHHVKHPEKALAEIYRVLKPKGMACLLEPNYAATSIYPLDYSASIALIEKVMAPVQHNDMGKKLLALTKKTGFSLLDISCDAVINRDFNFINTVFKISEYLNEIYSPAKAKKLIAAFKKADADKTFIYAMPMFQVLLSKK